MASVTGPQALNALSKAPKIPATDAAFLEMLGPDAEGAPDYISTDFWKWVTVDKDASGHSTGHVLRILVPPDYVALGDAGTEFPVSRVSPYAAQAAAERLGSILPTRKLVADVEAASHPHIGYLDVKAAPFHLPLSAIETPEAADDLAQMRRVALDTYELDPASLDEPIFGYRKSIVVGPELDGSRVAIFGGHYGLAGGVFTRDGNRVQPYSTIHQWDYADYSHGIMLVSRKCELDGEACDLRTDVFGSSDPKVVALVSDQGRFDPVFPNAGSKSVAKFRGTAPVPPGVALPKGGGGGGAPVASSSSRAMPALKVFGVVAAAGLISRWVFG